METEDGWPASVRAGDGALHEVISVEDVWRVEEEWWRDSPITRTYFEAILDSGRRVTFFVDHVGGKWFAQRHG